MNRKCQIKSILGLVCSFHISAKITPPKAETAYKNPLIFGISRIFFLYVKLAISQIGIVSQESILFNQSVQSNISLVKPEATFEEILFAAKLAEADKFINQLPNGYGTIIGEKGSILSGGQKQRISIARAILKNPEILILDEATSSLDTESEKLVQKALENIMKGRTAIVIAHRLSTIQQADEIIVMNDGEIIEKGSHSELILKKKAYYNLVRLQEI